MPGRIRTVKPSFFLHEELYDLEQETGLPIRLAYAGLWTQADREGRFRWRPRELKTQILPYDEVDFSRVLDALSGRAFITRYQVGGQDYGVIPTFLRHQVINNRERQSELPAPPSTSDEETTSTREARVDDASPIIASPAQGEGKGREGNWNGNGKEGKESSSAAVAATEPSHGQILEVFSHYRGYHPRSHPKPVPTSKEWKLIEARLKEGYTVADLCAAIDGCHKSPFHLGENDTGKRYTNLDLIVRDSSHVNDFIEIASTDSGPALSERTRRTLRAGQQFLEGDGVLTDGQAEPAEIRRIDSSAGDDVSSLRL
jgi:hypothetical protein